MAVRDVISSPRFRVRLARTAQDLHAAQRLRYEVFYEEGNARAGEAARHQRRDEDRFDRICDHLLVLGPAADDASQVTTLEGQRVIGTYRLLRRSVADAHDGFYSAGEFDIDRLLDARPESGFLELGRSCVLKEFRNSPAIALLWQAIWDYVRAHSIDVMIGCASLPGTDADTLAEQLSYLAHFHLAPSGWRASARSDRFIEMNRLPQSAIDPRQTLRRLPPLIRGYLRLGAWVGDGAVADFEFGTTDVLIILPVSRINPRYFGHFGAPAKARGLVTP